MLSICSTCKTYNISVSIIHVRKINEGKDPAQAFPVSEGRAKRWTQAFWLPSPRPQDELPRVILEWALREPGSCRFPLAPVRPGWSWGWRRKEAWNPGCTGLQHPEKLHFSLVELFQELLSSRVTPFPHSLPNLCHHLICLKNHAGQDSSPSGTQGFPTGKRPVFILVELVRYSS